MNINFGAEVSEFLNDLNKLAEKLEESFHLRSVEPSPGDTFDVNYTSDYAERFYYINTDYILPLHSLHDGEIVEFRGHRKHGHDIVSWDDVVDSIDNSAYPDDVTVEVVGNKNAHRDSNESSALNWLSQWAARNPNLKESAFVRNLLWQIRGQ